MSGVNFNSNGLKISGNIYIPRSIREEDTLPAIVVVHPFTRIKEQLPAIYSKLLIEQGLSRLLLMQLTKVKVKEHHGSVKILTNVSKISSLLLPT